MKWSDFRRKYDEASDSEKMAMLESGEGSDINVLKYFVDPTNYENLTKEEIWDALSVLTALFCDKHGDLLNLENTIEKKLGEEKCYEICAASVPDVPCERAENILKVEDSTEKAKIALEYLKELG